MGFLSEFKKFAMRGNVVDMAVGIIIGAAFGRIVTSLVSDVVMPPIGMLLGGTDFSNLAVTLKAATPAKPAVVMAYGQFINTVIDFLIIAMAIFVMIRFINKLDRTKAQPAKAPEPTTEEKLLTEIRDLLKEDVKK